MLGNSRQSRRVEGKWKEAKLSLSYSANDDDHDDNTGNDYDDFRLKWMSIN